MRFEEQVQGGAGDMKKKRAVFDEGCLLVSWKLKPNQQLSRKNKHAAQRWQQDAGQHTDGQSSIFKGSHWAEGKNI